MAQDGGVPGANARKEGTHALVLGAGMGLGSLVYPHHTSSNGILAGYSHCLWGQKEE